MDTDSQQKPQHGHRRKWRARNPRRKSQENERINSDTKSTEVKVTGKDVENKKRERILVKTSDIEMLPAPVPQQLAALADLLTMILAKYGMAKQDIDNRMGILQQFQQFFSEETQDGDIRLFGSSTSLLGLKTSDVNLDIYEVEEANIPKIFMRFLNVLKNSDNYADVKEEFQSNTPAINFIDIKSGLTCRVTTKNQSAFLTTNLLRVYGELDHRVKPLCVAFKLWAKICKVDNPACGTLPRYAFVLLVVHFLQQTNPPVLPVIHEMFDDNNIDKCFETEKSTQATLTNIRGKWKTENTECLGALWLGLLRYYTNEDEIQRFVVNVKSARRCLRSPRKWGKKRFAIEDPFSIKRNVARTLTKNTYHRYVVEHLKIALVYFGRFPCSVPAVDHLSHIVSECGSASADNGSRIANKDDKEVKQEAHSSSESDQESDDDEEDKGSEDNYSDDDDDVDDGLNDLVDGAFAIDNINDSTNTDSEDSEATPSDITVKHLKTPQDNLGVPGDDVSSEITNGMVVDDMAIKWDNLEYSFNDSVLRIGPDLDTSCSFCGEDGHIVENCTANEKIELKKLPELTNWFKETLNAVCVCCANDFGITGDEVKCRHTIKTALEAYIRRQLPGARLHLFGSSCNGLGFRESDLDICMMFEGKKKSDIDCVSTITFLAKLLRANPECGDVIAITGAKVPIVKFFLKRERLEADISLYNEVALFNTKLLATYVQIDRRVHVLGCALKIFVKLCEIGDASRGSLSSYAYILMLLHFLQQRQPPVLPVLQELYNSDEMPTVIVDGCNCWFYDDIKNLGSKWTSQNTEGCGELWLGFLRYYTERFDFDRHVVCIRSSRPLTKFEKMWNGRKICIEDPFVLSHNLGTGLSAPMAKFILSILVKARDRFGTPRQDIPQNGQMRQRFFFDPVVLNDGRVPPSGRNCNICGKIGHRAKECPYKKSNREGKNQRKKNQKDKEKKVVINVVEEGGKNVANVNVSTTGVAVGPIRNEGPRPPNVGRINATALGNPHQNVIVGERPGLLRHAPPPPMTRSPQRGPMQPYLTRVPSPNFRFPGNTRSLAPSFVGSPPPPLRVPGISTTIGQRNIPPPHSLMSANRFVMNSPPLHQPFGSPPLQHTAIGSPLAPAVPPRYAEIRPVPLMPADVFAKTSPRMITCEALEKQSCDEVDGTQRREHRVMSSDSGHNNRGLPPSLVQSLQAVTLNNCFEKGEHSYSNITNNLPMNLSGDTRGTPNQATDGRRLDHHLFSTPPKVQNVAEQSMYQTFDEFASSVKTSPGMPLRTPEQKLQPKNEVGEKAVSDPECEQNTQKHEVNTMRAEEPRDYINEDEHPKEQSKKPRRRRNRRKRRNNRNNEETNQTSGIENVQRDLKDEKQDVEKKDIDKKPATPSNVCGKETFNREGVIKKNTQMDKPSSRPSTVAENHVKTQTENEGIRGKPGCSPKARFVKEGTSLSSGKQNNAKQGSPNKEVVNVGQELATDTANTATQPKKRGDKKSRNAYRDSSSKGKYTPQNRKGHTEKQPKNPYKEAGKDEFRPSSGKKHPQNDKKQTMSSRGKGVVPSKTPQTDRVNDTSQQPKKNPNPKQQKVTESATLLVKVMAQQERKVAFESKKNSNVNEITNATKSDAMKFRERKEDQHHRTVKQPIKKGQIPTHD